MEGPYLFFSRLKASQEYIQGLFARQDIDEDLTLYRSETFDILDCDNHCEITRLLIAIFRHLSEQEQSQLPGNYGKN